MGLISLTQIRANARAMSTDEATHRRAFDLRNRAFHLQLEAAREYDETRRRHMLDLAGTYQRAADELTPSKPPTAE